MPLTIGNDKAQIFSFQVKRTWIGTVLRKIQGQEHRPNKCLLINACSWLFFADDTNFNDNIDIQFFTDFYGCKTTVLYQLFQFVKLKYKLMLQKDA